MIYEFVIRKTYRGIKAVSIKDSSSKSIEELLEDIRHDLEEGRVESIKIVTRG